MSRLPPGAAFVLSAQRCTQLALARGAILRFWQQEGGIPAGLREDLDEMVAIAREREVRVRRDTQAIPPGAGANRGSDPVRIFDRSPDGGEAVYIGMNEACERLGITEAAVRKALDEKHLFGFQRGGKGCRWLLDLESVENYNARRSPRKDAKSA